MTLLPFGLIFLASVMVIGIPLILNIGAWFRDRNFGKELNRIQNQPVTLPEAITDFPRISFLIPAWQEEKMIKRCLEAVLNLPYPDFEIIVCAGGRDSTFAVASNFASQKIIVLEQKLGEGKQHALQRCLEASNGEIIYLIDADCVIEPPTFLRCIRPILLTDERAVTGSFYIPLPEQRQDPFIVSQLATQAYPAAHKNQHLKGLLGGNCVIHRSALQAAGEFSNPVKTGTDYDLAKRLASIGIRINNQPLGSIQADFPENFRSYFRQQTRWLRNVIWHGTRHQATSEVRQNILTALIGFFMLAIPLTAGFLLFAGETWILVGILLFAGWALLFFHAFFSRIRYIAFCQAWLNIPYRQKDIISLPIFIFIDFVIWASSLIQLIFQPARQQW